MISTTTLRQSVTPPSLLGRVSAINIMSYGARPLGSALGAIVGGLYGAEACLYLAAAIFGAQALVIWVSPAVALARQPDMVGEPAGCSKATMSKPGSRHDATSGFKLVERSVLPV